MQRRLGLVDLLWKCGRIRVSVDISFENQHLFIKNILYICCDNKTSKLTNLVFFQVHLKMKHNLLLKHERKKELLTF